MNKAKFDELKRLVGRAGYKYWYKKSAPIFECHPLRNEDDLIKLVAFAYSWMPKVPLNYKKLRDWEKFKNEVKRLRRNDNTVRKPLINSLIPVANNSIVGASKVLYFLSPKNTPIIDSNVASAWRKLLYDNDIRKIQNKEIAPIPSSYGAFTQKLPKKDHVELYIKYWDNLFMWANECGPRVTHRDIEKYLYLYGQKLRVKLKMYNETGGLVNSTVMCKTKR